MALSPVAVLYNNVEVPRVGLGTWQLKGEECFNSVSTALKVGYKLLDTASAYENEEQVGKALQEYKKTVDSSASSQKLKIETGNEYGIFITSKAKTSEIGSEKTYKACHESLKRLQLPKLDLYLLHWPGSSGLAVDSEQNRSVRRAAWMEMEKLYNEGKVRAIGVSNYLVNHLNQLIRDGVNIKPMINQLEYHPLCQNEELIAWAKDNKMQLQAYSSLGIGNTQLLKHPTILDISNEVGRTPAQVLLRWSLQKDFCVIPRSKTANRIVENFDVTNFQLNESFMKKISSISEKARFCWDPTTVV